ncbi:MAG TPA: NIPSNAP family protein [Candidatus Limnocylindrales bacterium]|nr:NIPSNAP family protein [Candidatus Limnocylindrales bacterium]
MAHRLLLLIALIAGCAAAQQHRVFELRTYTAVEGRLPALEARFRDHTIAIFKKHGMESIGYWIPKDRPNTLIYILAHPSMDEAKKHWAEFTADPEWVKVKADSETNAGGKLTVKTESVYMDPTDYSALK